jgi:hypothetical protein
LQNRCGLALNRKLPFLDGHYLKTNPELVQRIRDDLGSKKIHWRLERLSQRVLYAPETRSEVAELFVEYCHVVIADLLPVTNSAGGPKSGSRWT